MTYEAVSQTPNDSPKKPNKCASFCNFIWNPKEKTCLGRTAKSWLLIFIFYVIYYACLSGFFVGMLSVLMNCFIDRSRPMYTGDNNILRFQAGLNVQPKMEKVHGASIYLNSKHSKEYLNNVETFFNKEFLPTTEQRDGIVNCSKTSDKPAQFCIFPKSHLGNCLDPKTELEKGNICVFVRVNKVFGWVPDVKNGTDILIECGGQSPADTSHLKTPRYHPSIKVGNKTYGVISNKYFPYLNQKNYTSPMVALQFPNMANNLAILATCKIVNLNNAYGQVRFDLMIITVKDNEM